MRLERWTQGDREALAAICNHIDRRYLTNRIPQPYTLEAARWWLNLVEAQEGTRGVFRKIVVAGQAVGCISVEQGDDVYGRDAEIGYYLVPEACARGVMTRAVDQICAEAFRALDIIRITGRVCAPNVASRRVLEKNGFALEGIKRRAFVKGEDVMDVCLYGRLK